VWQIAALLRVSVSYIYKALIRRRRTGETAVRMPCGRPPRKLAGHEQALLTRLGAEPDATLAELRAVPYGHWTTTTFVAGLRCDGLTAPFVIVDRSTANGSAPMSRRCSHRRCGPEPLCRSASGI
jgi:hypothetical protein